MTGDKKFQSKHWGNRSMWYFSPTIMVRVLTSFLSAYCFLGPLLSALQKSVHLFLINFLGSTYWFIKSSQYLMRQAFLLLPLYRWVNWDFWILSSLSKFVSRKEFLQSQCPDQSTPETSLQTISTNLPTGGVAGALGSFECWPSPLSETGYLEQGCLLSSWSVRSSVSMLMDNVESILF